GSPPTTRWPPCPRRRPRPRRRGAWPAPAWPRSSSCVLHSEQLLRQEQHERPLLQAVPFVRVGNALDLVGLVDDAIGVVVGLQQRNGAASLHFLIDLVIVDRA